MSTGPLRRAIGLVGLLALVPVLLQLAAGAITPEDAAMRGTVVAVVVVGLGRLAQHTLQGLLRRVERRREDRGESEDAFGADPEAVRGPDLGT